MHRLFEPKLNFYIRNYFNCNWKKLIFLGKGIEPKFTFCRVIMPKGNTHCLFEFKLYFDVRNLFWFFTLKYDFSRKRHEPTFPLFHVITPKRRHISGAPFIRPKNALCTLDVGIAEGAKVYLAKNAPPLFWVLALAYVVQVLTSLSTPLEEWGAREARRGEGERATSI